VQGTLIELWQRRVAETPDRPAVLRSLAGRWESLSWAQLDRETDQLACGLLSLGVQPADRVAIISRNRLEWAEADLAVMKIAACSVPIHPDAAASDMVHMLEDSGARVVFVQDEKLLPLLRPLEGRLQKTILFAGAAQAGEMRWSELLAAGATFRAEFPDRLGLVRQQVVPETLASIVYTAGTTGRPKGVMLVHDNFVFEIEALRQALGGYIGQDDVHLLCLPLAHILGRILMLTAVEVGYANAFSSGLDNLWSDLVEVKPTFVTVVPAVLERIHAALQGRLEEGALPLRVGMRWAISLARQVAEKRRRRLPLSPLMAVGHHLAGGLLFGRVLKRHLGGRLKFFISGGAPLSVEIACWLERLGIQVLEGYGLTENTGAANVNRPDRCRFGSVGPPLPGIEQRIGPGGEILIRGRNVMRGYYRREEATREALDEEGWLHTGDVGYLDEEGFLHITDRKKDIIVTSTGKNVSPQNIEALMRTSPYIEQIMVLGDGRPYLTALISPEREEIQRFAERQGIAFDRFEELAAHPMVRQLISEEIEARNRQLAGYEAVRSFALVPEPFSLETGEITPTMKLRRAHIEARYRDLIEWMYSEARGGAEGGEG